MFNFPKLTEPARQAFTISAFEGLDRRIGAGEKTLSAAQNMSAENLPVLSTRKGRKKLFTAEASEKITGIFGLDMAYMTTEKDGKTRLYAGKDFSSLERVFVSNDDELASSLVCKFDNRVCVFNLKTGINEGTMAGIILSMPDNPTRFNAPTLTDVMVYANRIVGCRKNQIRTSVAGDAGDWDYNFETEDESFAAYYSKHELKSDFTACTTYKNRAVFFTSDEMFEFIGKDPTQFSLVKIADVGCLNRKSVCEVDGELYFLSKNGVMKYSGSVPVMISDELDCRPASADSCLSGAGRTLYVKISDECESSLYSYNTESRLWSREDDISAIDLASYEGYTYLATDSELYKFSVDFKRDGENNDGASFPWQFTLQENHSYCSYKKRSSRLDLHIKQPVCHRVSVYASFDGGDFKLMQNSLNKNGVVSVLMKPKSYDSIKIKVCGKGQADISYLTHTFSLGGRK